MSEEHETDGWSCLERRGDGHLYVAGRDTVDLARRYGTPLYVMDEEMFVQRARSFQEAWKRRGNDEVAYAGKAFLSTGMARLVARMGLALDVVSGGELETALRAGLGLHCAR